MRHGPPVRALVVVLVLQVVLGGAIVFAAVHGFPLIGGGGDGSQPARPDRGAAALAPVPRVDRFDAARAFRLLRYQVQTIGPRPAGSAAGHRTAAWIHAQLPHAGYEAIPGHPDLRNVVGVLPGRRPAIVVGAHFDTVDTPVGMPGANDGASGTAVLLELARRLRPVPGGRQIRFVAFDGEEAPGDKDFLRTGLRGSRADAAAHARDTKAMVLLDYVGDRDLSLPREGSSDRALWGLLRAAARSVGVASALPDRTGQVVYDDHTPYLQAGIPAIDLIDWPYRYMHTLQDTVDKTSPRSLDAVGETVYALVDDLRRR